MTDNHEVVVRVAELAVERAGATIVSWGLGSCVALMIVDPHGGIAGMAHVLLPSASLSRDTTSPGKFPETAIPLLLERIRRLGGDPNRCVAKLVGGSTMFAALLAPGTLHMGERNVLACRSALHEAGIPIIAEDVGGEQGRSVWLESATGRVVVRSVGRADVIL